VSKQAEHAAEAEQNNISRCTDLDSCFDGGSMDPAFSPFQIRNCRFFTNAPQLVSM
jgi:hypothetical protein